MLTADIVTNIFQRMNQELYKNGEEATLYIFGGVALFFSTNKERPTADIDAVFTHTPTMGRIIKTVGEEFGLEDGWLNDAGKGFINPEWVDSGEEIFCGTNLVAYIATPEQLLAMKVAAARTDKDTQDILNLAHYLNLSTSEEVLELAEKELGSLADYLLQPKSFFLVQELFS